MENETEENRDMFDENNKGYKGSTSVHEQQETIH